MISIISATRRTIITTPTPNFASSFEILAETSKMLLQYTHTVILATLAQERSRFRTTENHQMHQLTHNTHKLPFFHLIGQKSFL